MKKLLTLVFCLISFNAFANGAALNPPFGMVISPNQAYFNLGETLSRDDDGNINVVTPEDTVINSLPATLTSDACSTTVVVTDQEGGTLTLPEATTTGFGQGCSFTLKNAGGGDITFTSVDLIDNVYSLDVDQNDGMVVRSIGSAYRTALSHNLYTYNPTFETGDMTTDDSRLDVANTSTISCSYINSSGLVAYTDAGSCAGRIDYDMDTLALKGVAIEPQRTNLMNYSNSLSNWSNNGAVSITDNSITSPDGTQNATAIVVNGAYSRGVFKSASLSESTQYTVSAFLYVDDAANFDCVSFGSTSADGGSALVSFNVDTGAVLEVGAGVESYYSESIGNWRYATITFTTAAAQTSSTFVAYTRNTASTQTGTFSVWGYQIEDGSFSTSLITTAGSTLTRNADTVSYASPYWFANDSGTACFDFILKENTASGVVFGDGTLDRSLLYVNSSNAGSDDGINDVDYALAIPAVGTINKTCIRYGNSLSNVSINGSHGTEQTFDNDFDITGFNIFRDYADTNNLYGNINNWTWYSYSLTDSQMDSITTP